MIRGDVLYKRGSQPKIQEIERIGKNRKQDPRAEIADIEVRQNIGSEEQAYQKAPRTPKHVKKRVRDELLRKLSQKSNRLRIVHLKDFFANDGSGVTNFV